MSSVIHIRGKEALSRGKCIGTKITNRGIELETTTKSVGYYVGPIIDMDVSEHAWSKMRIMVEARSETNILLYALAIDELEALTLPFPMDYKTWLKDERPQNEVLEYIKSLGAKRYEAPDEVLLYGLKGRYLIFWVELYTNYASDCLERFEIEYDKESWMGYLPQIYRENADFLERYLAVFQTPFDHLERFIDHLPMLYVPEQTHTEYLEVLNRWLNIDGFDYWPEPKKRRLLKTFSEINRMRGTRKGLVEIIKLHIDVEPMIVESIDIKAFMQHEGLGPLYDKLYDADSYGLTVILPASAFRDGKATQEGLMAVIKGYIPIQARLKIVLMEDHMVLGEHTYVGVNTRLFDKQKITLNNRTMISMGIIGDDEERMGAHAES